MYSCNDCHTLFSTETKLNSHKTGKRFCLDYKDVIFICSKCNYITKGIRNINNHKSTCLSTENFENLYINDSHSPLVVINDHKEEEISNLQKEIKKLELQLKLEKTKNLIYTQIIHQKLNIKFDDFIEEKEDGFHIYEFEKSGELSIHIHEKLKKEGIGNIIKHEDKVSEIITTTTEVPADTKPKKQQYRPIKIDNENIEIPKTPARKNYDLLDKSPYIVYEDDDEDDNIDIDITKTHAIIQDCFEALKNSRSYNKTLESIKTHRNNLLSVMSTDTYIELIHTHNKVLEKIFKDKDAKKSSSLILRSMSAIDARLIFYNGYDDCQIITDDIQRFKKSLHILANYMNDYVIFDSLKLYSNFYNYSCVLFNIKENITRFLVNKNSFYNVIYVPLPKSTDSDPYSFYTLEKITKKHREWNMDCRLETLSNNFVHNIRPYLIQTFRKIYFDVFHDNSYRSTHTNKTQIIECDCEQLIRNIMTLLDPILFSRVLRIIVKENAIYIPTDNDKFNLRHDDNLQKKKFEKYKIDETDCLKVVKTMFDDISTEDALDFYRKKSQNLF